MTLGIYGLIGEYLSLSHMPTIFTSHFHFIKTYFTWLRKKGLISIYTVNELTSLNIEKYFIRKITRIYSKLNYLNFSMKRMIKVKKYNSTIGNGGKFNLLFLRKKNTLTFQGIQVREKEENLPPFPFLLKTLK